MSAGKKTIGCPAELTVEVIRGRWKLMILRELCVDTVRFGRLRRALKGISEKVLTQHLRELERDGIIKRFAYDETPPRVEYSLTAAGQELKPIIDALHAWGAAHAPKAKPRANAAAVT
jgi:DNA-binding HxlR family transcriptional regulator